MRELQILHEVTIYHLDNDALLVTHYCGSGNQPRMKSAGFQDGKIEFTFLDVSNARPGTGYISGVTFEFIDSNSFIQRWSYLNGAGKTQTMEWKLNRLTR
jgi:hypothetical protein